MKGRTGFLIGAAVGYVMGAGAGKECYGRLNGMYRRATATEQVQTALDATAKPRAEVRRIIGDQLRKASRELSDSRDPPRSGTTRSRTPRQS